MVSGAVPGAVVGADADVFPPGPSDAGLVSVRAPLLSGVSATWAPVSAGTVSVGGAAVSGTVTVGTVSAGAVSTGFVSAGLVSAGFVSAGLVSAGFVSAGFVCCAAGLVPDVVAFVSEPSS